MLDKHADNLFLTASNTYITRASSQITASFFSKDTRISPSSTCYPKLITVADSTIAFVLIQEQYSSDRDFRFYNFYRRNNRWEELKINDLLQIQGEKRWLMNDLITKKVKALKDQQIDCSNASAFITTVENRFMLTKDGIDFCFDSTENSREFVVISFTWAELSPFLKLKIY